MNFDFELKPGLSMALDGDVDDQTPQGILQAVGNAIAGKTNNRLYAIVTGTESYDGQGKQYGNVTAALTIIAESAHEHGVFGGRLLEVEYPFDNPWSNETKFIIWNKISARPKAEKFTVSGRHELEAEIAKALARDDVQEWMTDLLVSANQKTF